MNAFRNFFKGFRKIRGIYQDPSFYARNENLSRRSLILMSAIILASNERFYSKKLHLAEGPTPKDSEKIQKELAELSREQKLASLRKLIKYEVCASENLKEGDIMEIEIGEEIKHKIIIIRSDNQLYALGPVCTYDGKTQLKEGIVFGDKLYCPLHGCAYSIRTGRAEYAPAIDSLPRFHVEEKNGKISVYAPKIPPIKIIAPSGYRDYNDLRKIVIIGAGAAGFACAETLRQFGYTGEITMISKDTKLPYDKTKLNKSFRNLDYEDLLLRDREWYRENGITYLLGREVINVNNVHGGPHVILEDGLKLEYDGLLIATGTSPEIRFIPGCENKENIYFLRNIQDHKKLKKELEKIKHLTVLGLNLRSLETVSTIRQEYPDIQITVIDENDKNSLENNLGSDIADTLINLHMEHGVSFIQGSHVNMYDGNEKRIDKICFSTGFEMKTDAVVYFPNNVLANTEFIGDNEHMDQFDYDEMSRVRTDFNQRGGYKRIFVAGEAASSMYHPTMERLITDSWNTCYHQGSVAAYNLMALDVPFHQIPFNFTTHYGKILQYSGYVNFYDEMYIEGDLKNFNFVAYYSWNGEIVAACGTPNRQRSMLIINEALRLGMLPPLSEIVERKKTIESIYLDIIKNKRSGCFKDLIENVKYDPNPEEVLWLRRERIDEHYNFWEKGLEPTNPKTVYSN